VNVSGVYCANTIDLTNSAKLTGTATFIANNFGGGGVSDSGTVSPDIDHIVLWMTGSGTQQINSSTFLNGGVIFAPSGEIYLNSNALTGGTQRFLIEADAFYMSSVNGGTWESPSGLTGDSTTKTTTTVVPTTSTTTTVVPTSSSSSTVITTSSSSTTVVPTTSTTTTATTTNSTSTSYGSGGSNLSG